MDLEAFGFADFSSGVSNAVEAPVLDRVITPTIESRGVELPVLRVKSASHDPGEKLSFQRNHRALRTRTSGVPQNEIMHGRPVTQPDVGSLEGPPLVARDLLHSAGRIVDASWNETQRRGNSLAAQAVLFTLVDLNDGRSRGPGSLLRRRPKIIVRSAYSHAVAHPRADYLGRAVRARTHDGGPLDEVKGSVLGAVQTESGVWLRL